MRFREFVPEEYLKIKEDNASSAQLAAVLVSILQFIKGRAEDQKAPAKISTSSLINLVKNAGHPNFSYADLVDAHEQMDTVKNLVKSFSKDEVILRTDDDANDSEADDLMSQPTQDSEDTVKSMAKRSLKTRQ